MSTRTYDPFAIERPKLRLGGHGEWELGEMHDTRIAAFNSWRDAFFALGDDENAMIKDFARIVGELISAACLDAKNAPEILEDLCDFEKHGDETRGTQTLHGIVKFLSDYALGEVEAGEG